ncbi:MAG TPA: allantoate amidohydrolase [Lichenihabitans sp.]|jgi:allantoate deiminase|nr:allantoate amidohydrolase [Lichenihabitans sp.]
MTDLSFAARSKPNDRTARVMARLDELATLSSDGEALTRLYLTPEHKAAALKVMGWMEDAGMAASLDAVGNVVGRYAGSAPDAGTLILGSHIDTVRDAGRYDGNFGVVAAIEAVAELHARQERLAVAIEIIAFGDEEGVRFPVTLSGSRAVAGTFDPAALDVTDDAGISLRAALDAFGGDPRAIAAIGRRKADILGYVEAHIEQGPVLEAEGLPVGIVTAIAGASRFKVEVEGVAGHAGTVPMRLRRDALAAAAEMISTVERTALDAPDLVATVGRIEVQPGAVNVIPARAGFTVDLRSPSDAVRRHALGALHATFADIAARRGVSVAVVPFYDEAAAPCAPPLQQALEAAVQAEGIRPLCLPSGAGHDGLAMIALCPIAMLFVRCAGGISHNPAESIAAEDAETAVRVLVAFLRRLDRTTLSTRTP